MTATAHVTETGGRKATTRRIPAKHALAVGMPSTPAPPGWRWSLLTDLARLESGHTPSRRHPEYWGGSIPWIGIADARRHDGGTVFETEETTNALGIANSSARVLPENTVCLSRTASVGYVVVMGRQMATSQDFVNWVCSMNLDHKFLKYLLIAEDEDLLRFSSGSVHQTIYFPEVKAFHICHPPLSEQRRIIRILDLALKSTATAKANAERNLRNARTLFESHLNSVFTQRGDGWVDRRLSEVAESVSTGPFGTMLHKADYVPNGIPLVNPMHLVDSTIVPSVKMMVSKETTKRLSAYVLKAGDIVIGRRGELGRCALVTAQEEGWLCGTGCFFVRLSGALDGEYFVTLFGSAAFKARLEASSVGATMSSLNHGILNNLIIPVPPRSEQRRIMQKSRELLSVTRRLAGVYERKLLAFEALSKSLLHQAFTGQL